MKTVLYFFLMLISFCLASTQQLQAANITIEPESGFLTSPATKGSDNNAFGGKFIYLGQWPNATNTGVLAVYDANLGRKLQYSDLTPMSGLIRIDEDWVNAHGGSRVAENLDITGSLVVLTNNVTIRRCRITGTNNGSVININWGYGGLTGLVFEDLEVSNPFESGISIDDAVVRRCYIHHLGGDGVGIGTHATLEDTYITDLFEQPGSHNDGVQTGGGINIIIRHNHIENPLTQTSCIMLSTDFSALTNPLVEGNLLDGGGYTIYGGGADGTYVRILNNRWGRSFHPSGGYFGPIAAFNTIGTGNQWSENVWDDTGATLNP